mgnify:CR=1 FL=1
MSFSKSKRETIFAEIARKSNEKPKQRQVDQPVFPAKSELPFPSLSLTESKNQVEELKSK